ncbi:MAG: hypothetical protein QOJ42_3362, partial [Acidobacteriaceae bacterium]|nr:hypothetical protein [Acidobacteriaceae bacterium]
MGRPEAVLVAPALASSSSNAPRQRRCSGYSASADRSSRIAVRELRFLIERLSCAPESLGLGEEVAFRVRLHTDAASSKHKLSTREFVLGAFHEKALSDRRIVAWGWLRLGGTHRHLA